MRRSRRRGGAGFVAWVFVAKSGSAFTIGLAFLAYIGSADAHFAERTRSIAGYVSRSEIVVAGVIDEWSEQLKAGHSERNGFGLLRVEETLKGEVPAGTSLRFEASGIHQPTYPPDEHVLLFLNRIPDSNPPHYLTMQNSLERIGLGSDSAATILGAVREYVAIEQIHEPGVKLERLKTATLRFLASSLPILWQNALLDLSTRSDLPLDSSDVAILRGLTMDETRPGILRVGCVAKLKAMGSTRNRLALKAMEDVVSSNAAPFVRALAATALQEIGAPSSLPTLVAALQDSSPAVREAAANGLGRLRRSDAIPPLARTARSDSNRLVRFSALKAIARIGGAVAEQALAELRKHSGDPKVSQQIDLARREIEQQSPVKEAR